MVVPRAPRNMLRPHKLPLLSLNDYLTCKLCRGYYIDATTIIECLHSFCRSCIVKYLETNKYCPICDVQVHKTKPLLNIRSDKILQSIVYKLVPRLFQNEMLRRKSFYTSHPEAKTNLDVEELGEASFQHILAPDESICVSLNYKDSPLTPRYLQCSAAVSIFHLQKLIRSKYDLTSNHRIDIFHSEDALNPCLTLIDVAYSSLWRRKGPLELTYKIYENTTDSTELHLNSSGVTINNNNASNDWKEVQIQISENGEMSVTGIQDCLDLLEKMDNSNDDKPSSKEQSEKSDTKPTKNAKKEAISVEKLAEIDKIKKPELKMNSKSQIVETKPVKVNSKITKVDLMEPKPENIPPIVKTNEKIESPLPIFRLTVAELRELSKIEAEAMAKSENQPPPAKKPKKDMPDLKLIGSNNNKTTKKNGAKATVTSLQTPATTGSTVNITSIVTLVPANNTNTNTTIVTTSNTVSITSSVTVTSSNASVNVSSSNKPVNVSSTNATSSSIPQVSKRKLESTSTSTGDITAPSKVSKPTILNHSLGLPLTHNLSNNHPLKRHANEVSNKTRALSPILTVCSKWTSASSVAASASAVKTYGAVINVPKPPTQLMGNRGAGAVLPVGTVSTANLTPTFFTSTPHTATTTPPVKYTTPPPTISTITSVSSAITTTSTSSLPIDSHPTPTTSTSTASSSSSSASALVVGGIRSKASTPIGYKTLKDPPKPWNPTLLKTQTQHGVAVKGGDLKNVRPAKFFKMRNNLPRYLGCPNSGVKPMFQVHVSPEKEKQTASSTPTITTNSTSSMSNSTTTLTTMSSSQSTSTTNSLSNSSPSILSISHSPAITTTTSSSSTTTSSSTAPVSSSAASICTTSGTTSSSSDTICTTSGTTSSSTGTSSTSSVTATSSSTAVTVLSQSVVAPTVAVTKAEVIRKHSIVKIDPKTLRPISERAPDCSNLSSKTTTVTSKIELNAKQDGGNIGAMIDGSSQSPSRSNSQSSTNQTPKSELNLRINTTSVSITNPLKKSPHSPKKSTSPTSSSNLAQAKLNQSQSSKLKQPSQSNHHKHNTGPFHQSQQLSPVTKQQPQLSNKQLSPVSKQQLSKQQHQQQLSPTTTLNYTQSNPFIPNLQSPTLNPNQFLLAAAAAAAAGFHYDPSRYMSAYHHHAHPHLHQMQQHYSAGQQQQQQQQQQQGGFSPAAAAAARFNWWTPPQSQQGAAVAGGSVTALAQQQMMAAAAAAAHAQAQHAAGSSSAGAAQLTGSPVSRNSSPRMLWNGPDSSLTDQKTPRDAKSATLDAAAASSKSSSVSAAATAAAPSPESAQKLETRNKRDVAKSEQHHVTYSGKTGNHAKSKKEVKTSAHVTNQIEKDVNKTSKDICAERISKHGSNESDMKLTVDKTDDKKVKTTNETSQSGTKTQKTTCDKSSPKENVALAVT